MITADFGTGYKETLNGTGGQLQEHLTSNAVGNIEGSWSKRYVQDIWEANGIQPQTKWFNCLALARVVAPNANAAIGTTNVTLALLDWGEG